MYQLRPASPPPDSLSSSASAASASKGASRKTNSALLLSALRSEPMRDLKVLQGLLGGAAGGGGQVLSAPLPLDPEYRVCLISYYSLGTLQVAVQAQKAQLAIGLRGHCHGERAVRVAAGSNRCQHRPHASRM